MPEAIELEIDEDSAWWWEALRAGELRVPTCTSCAATFLPPMPACPSCGGTALSSVLSSGRGHVYSWVVVHLSPDPIFADEVPYTVVAVDLIEGGRLLGRFLGDQEGPEAGLAVEIAVQPAHGVPQIGFRAMA